MKITIVCFIAFCVLLLTGCDVERPAQPLILFSEEGCGLGCWQDLRLGMTDAEATQFFTDNFPEHHRRFEYEGTIHHTGVDIGKFSAQAYMRDNALHAIWLGTGIGFDLTLQQVIEELGEPSFSFWDYDIATESLNPLITFITLYYPEQGYIFDLNLPPQPLGRNDPVPICLTPDTRISDVYIVQRGTVESIIRDADHFTYPPQVERIMDNLVSWEGYECRTIAH